MTEVIIAMTLFIVITNMAYRKIKKNPVTIGLQYQYPEDLVESFTN